MALASRVVRATSSGLTLVMLVTTAAPAAADVTRAELEALAEQEGLVRPNPSPTDGAIARVAFEVRGGGFLTPTRGSGGGLGFRAGARFGRYAIEGQAALVLLGGGGGPTPPVDPNAQFIPSYVSGIGFFAPTSAHFLVIPSERLELGLGPSFDLVSTSSPTDIIPYFGVDGRVAVRLDVRANPDSRRWLLTLGLAPHLTFADTSLFSLYGTAGVLWE